MAKKYVFIDESGNPGLEQGCFVIAAIVVIKNTVLEELLQDIGLYKEEINWPKEAEFKFSKTRKSVIEDVLKILVRHDLEICCAIRERYRPIVPELKSEDSDFSLYNAVLVSLLDEIGGDISVLIDGKNSRKYRKKTNALIRRKISNRKIDIKYGNSKSYEELQLADLVAGAINRFWSNKKGGDMFFGILKKRIKKVIKV